MTPDKLNEGQIPQNDGDRKLSEQEKMAWVRYSSNQLSDEILNSLKVNVNGTNKYIKDVVYYNVDVEGIIKNPEELIKLQLFLKKKTKSNIEINGIYDKKTETAINEYRKNRNPEGELYYFQVKNPSFTALIQKYPAKFNEIKKRAMLYNELEKMRGEITYLAKNKESINIAKVQQALATNIDINFFNSKKLNTYIEGWNGPGSINYVWFGTDSITYAEYINRLLNKNVVVNELFGNIKISESASKLEESQKQQLEMAKIFMNSLISRYPNFNMDNKQAVDKIFKLLYSGDINAIDAINKLTSKVLKLTVNFNTKKGLSIALRAIGDTSAAGSVLYSEIKKSLNESKEKPEGSPDAFRNFNEKYTENYSSVSQNPKSINIVEKRFNEMMNNFSNDPTSEFYYIIGDEKKQRQIKQGLMSLIVFDETMKQTGPKGLGELAEIYDDMKGLNGLLNFSDENAKMTKEITIILASMVLTAGFATVLSCAGGALRVVQTSRIIKAINTANKASKITKLSSVIIKDAIIFSTINVGLKYKFHSEGEMIEDFSSFAKNVGVNIAMFGAFHGIGKITGGIINKYGINNTFAKFGTLTSGDIGGMYLLHCIETGRLELTREEFYVITAQAIGFRGIMKGIEQSFSKVYQKMKSISIGKNKKPKGTSKEVSQKVISQIGTEINTQKALKTSRKGWKNELLSSKKIPNKPNLAIVETKQTRKWGEETVIMRRDMNAKKTAVDLSINQYQKAIENIETKLRDFYKTRRELEINLDASKKAYERVKNSSPERVQKITERIKYEENELLNINTKISEYETQIAGLNNLIDHATNYRNNLINEKNKIRKQGESSTKGQNDNSTAKEGGNGNKTELAIIKEKRLLNNANKAKDILEKENLLVEKMKGIKENSEELLNAKKELRQLQKERKLLNNESKRIIKEDTNSKETKKDTANEGEKNILKLEEVPGKSKTQIIKDWIKNNPSLAVYGLILGVGGLYYKLNEDDNGGILIDDYFLEDMQSGEDDNGGNGDNSEDKESGNPNPDSQVPAPLGSKDEKDDSGNTRGNGGKDGAKNDKKENGGNDKKDGKKDSTKNGGTDNKQNNNKEIPEKRARELLGDLKNLYQNKYQDLKDIGLGDAFFGLDKGVELDENPIYLDYDGTINGRIIVNEKGEYQITLDNKKDVAGYSAKAVITGNELFETLKKGFIAGNDIRKAEHKAYRESVEKEEEKKRRLY